MEEGRCKFFLYPFLLFFLLSCKGERKDSVEYLIRNENYKVWDVLYDEEADIIYKNGIKRYLEGFVFYKEKDSLEYFEYKNSGKDKVSAYQYDVVLVKKWKLLNKTQMEFGGGKAEIEKLVEDTLILKTSNGKMILVKSKNQDPKVVEQKTGVHPIHP